MSEYPTLKRAALWIASQALPAFILITFSYALGYRSGHDAGRTEIKCAILAAIERLGEDEPAPGTITLGCELNAGRPAKTGAAA